MTLLNVQNLSVADILLSESFQIQPGERVGLVGESGSGKSMTALALMKLTPDTLPLGGSVELGDSGNLLVQPDSMLQKVRGKKIAMIFQEPMTALHPLHRVGQQVVEAMTIHGVDKGTAQARALELLKEVGVDRPRAYPHELSGGQRQRVLIAMALANDPDLLICDEPTTALDVTVQRTIVSLIVELTKHSHTAVLFITHDLALINQVTQRVLVLHQGRIVERGDTTEVLTRPQHEYTKRLLAGTRLKERTPSAATSTVLLEARSVSKAGRISDVSITLRAGQRLGVVGESGAGKSTLLNILSGLETPDSGTVHRDDAVRISAVFQDPASSLDPRMTVERIVAEPLGGRGGVRARVSAVLAEVGLDDSALQRYPHEFSGGQRQRISIARALISEPDILLADEPVSALDVSVRATVLDLLAKLVAERGVALLFVSHDLMVTQHLCEDVIVMQHGQVVERGPIDEVWAHPHNPYTQQLLDAVPRLP